MCRVKEYDLVVTAQGNIVEEFEVIRAPLEETITITQPNWVPDRFMAPGVTIQFRRRTREQLLQWDGMDALIDQAVQLEEDQALIPFDERMGGVDHLQLPEVSTGNTNIPEVPEEGDHGHVLDVEERDRIETIEIELQALIAQLEQPLLSSTEDNIVTI